MADFGDLLLANWFLECAIEDKHWYSVQMAKEMIAKYIETYDPNPPTDGYGTTHDFDEKWQPPVAANDKSIYDSNAQLINEWKPDL